MQDTAPATDVKLVRTVAMRGEFTECTNLRRFESYNGNVTFILIWIAD